MCRALPLCSLYYCCIDGQLACCWLRTCVSFRLQQFSCCLQMDADVRPSLYGTTVTETKYRCTFCSLVLSSKGSLRNHVIMLHTKTSRMKCHMCGQVFIRQDRLKRHLAICRGQRRRFEGLQHAQTGASSHM